jgi:hypothetical protein
MVKDRLISLVRSAVAASEARPGSVTYSYDAPSDTLMVHFFGIPRAATSVLIDDPFDSVYIRVDPESDEAVGLQIEGFAIDFVYRHPEMAETLLIADLRGITREEAAAIVDRAQQRGPRAAAVTSYLEHLIAG